MILGSIGVIQDSPTYRQGFIDGIEEEKKRSLRYSEIEKVLDALRIECNWVGGKQFNLATVKESLKKELKE
jgi:hypothetical protein